MQVALWLSVLIGALGPAGDIAFVDDADSSSARVCIVDLATGTQREIGPGQRDGAPQWSPDGVWLAFESNTPAGGRGVVVARGDGTEGQLLAHRQAWNVKPRWSSDGTRVVYSSASAAGGLMSIVIYDLNTGIEETWGGGGVGLLRPVWMPYTKLLWALDPDAPLSLGGVDVNRFLSEARMGRLSIVKGTLPEAVLAIQLLPGGEARGLQTTPVLVTKSEVFPFLGVALEENKIPTAVLWQVEPNWEGVAHDVNATTNNTYGVHPLSDTGEASRIVYESNEGGDREIYVLGKRGKANVSNHRSADWNPVWAPDGRRLAFESFRDGVRALYQVYTDTGLVMPLGKGGGRAWSPTWSPDSKALVFVSDRDGVDTLYVLEDEKATPARISEDTQPKAWPAWRPGVAK